MVVVGGKEGRACGGSVGHGVGHRGGSAPGEDGKGAGESADACTRGVGEDAEAGSHEKGAREVGERGEQVRNWEEGDDVGDGEQQRWWGGCVWNFGEEGVENGAQGGDLGGGGGCSCG